METLLNGLRAIAEHTRLRILAVVSHGELTVGELVSILGQSQPRVSRHLKLMTQAGVLQRFQEGTQVFYRISDTGPAADLILSLTPLMDYTDEQLKSDFAALSEIRQERFLKAQTYFGTNAEKWDEIRSLYVPEKRVEQCLLDLAAPGGSEELLDIGTGTGRVLEVFSPHIRSGLGVDISRAMLTVARGNLAGHNVSNCQVRFGDMYDLPAESERCDLAVFHQVLHYSEEPGRAIAEAARCLKPGGKLLIADFAPHEEEFLREEHAHRRLGFSDHEILRWAKAAGCRADASHSLGEGRLEVVVWSFIKDRMPAKGGQYD